MARREYQNPPLQKTDGQQAKWFIRVRKRVIGMGGKIVKEQDRVYFGLCSEVGVREAGRLRAEKLKEINGEVYTVSSKVKLCDFIVAFKQKHFPTTGRAAQLKYESLLSNHIMPAFGKLSLEQIGTEVIQGFLNEKAHLSWWTRNDLRNLLSSIFSRADDWGYWQQRNPVEKTKLPREKAKREKRLLTDEQVTTLLSELPADIALMIKLADSTGMRISEIIGLRWRNVDLGIGWLKVAEKTYRGHEGPTKSEKSERELPLGMLWEEFRDHYHKVTPQRDDYVFRHAVTGEPHDDRNLNQHFLRKVAKKYGWYWPGFGFHSFRRMTLTGVQADGGSTIEAQQIAGHSRPSTTAIYTQIQKTRTLQLVEKRQQRFNKVVNTKGRKLRKSSEPPQAISA